MAGPWTRYALAGVSLSPGLLSSGPAGGSALPHQSRPPVDVSALPPPIVGGAVDITVSVQIAVKNGENECEYAAHADLAEVTSYSPDVLADMLTRVAGTVVGTVREATLGQP